MAVNGDKTARAARRGLLAAAMLSVFAVMANAGRVPEPQAHSLSLERDCNGCAEGSRLQLSRDGTARISRLGKARFGGQDRHSDALLSRSEFDALIERLRQLGLAGLASRYQEEPDQQDGRWLLLRIEWAGAPATEIFCRGEAPAALLPLLAAIEAQQQRLGFAPDGRAIEH
ncbi:hypothetical protein RQP53_10655 [Paucibacter sp. APW11]|uniref:Uncharacterized protein n=1 Tax=Roseateles aquae TaxID=3077235 RepID=A0ABU3PBN9_9BURK|nr:hypothetical protein [Paucibacter sp. APW11]MDT8999727.1 hypothetical protein [Paucibacter sp. APW11]